jgi:hypothetical protein
VFVDFGRGQGAGRIQLRQIIFEHAFNIRSTTDATAVISVCRGARTTPQRSGQHPWLRVPTGYGDP